MTFISKKPLNWLTNLEKKASTPLLTCIKMFLQDQSVAKVFQTSMLSELTGNTQHALTLS